MTPNRRETRCYRRRSYTVTARQWDGTEEHAAELIEWMRANPETPNYPDANPSYTLDTGPGGPVIEITAWDMPPMRAFEGDWIVRTVGAVDAVEPDAKFRIQHEPVIEREGNDHPGIVSIMLYMAVGLLPTGAFPMLIGLAMFSPELLAGERVPAFPVVFSALFALAAMAGAFIAGHKAWSMNQRLRRALPSWESGRLDRGESW